MSLLATANTAADVNEEQDNIGGGGPLESGAYLANIEMAYLTQAKSGAVGLTLHLKTEKNGEVRETLWVVSGNEKGNKTFYEKDGVKNPLPGFALGNALTRMAIGTPLLEVPTEMKLVNLYDFDAKKEIPTSVEVLTGLLNQPIIMGILKQVEDKNAKGDDGQYHPTGETRERNELHKFFRASDKLTVAEILDEDCTAPVFYDKWVAKWAGVTRDRTSKDGAVKAGLPKGTAAAPAKSLFAQPAA